ncbi:DNA-directed RNA polymerase I largest subunit [Angomonas deanei]|nr:DNA-directed RNA polymerase I largest subunit [Angomonas deanei]|eukprot:EPY31342.1 DNA-directed RNA polymerase I largest subunit [Angomonas deanei]
MSLTTNFPFKSFRCDLRNRPLLEDKTGLSFALLSSEDMERMAMVEVTVPYTECNVQAPWTATARQAGEGRGERNTFFDTRMGNFHSPAIEHKPCSTCSATHIVNPQQGNERCIGHFGFIGMPRYAPLERHTFVNPALDTAGASTPNVPRMFLINPHSQKEVEKLLQAKCFFCHRFRVTSFDVQRYVQALRLVDAGLPGEALELLHSVMPSRYGEAVSNLRDPLSLPVLDVDSLHRHVEHILEKNAHKKTRDLQPVLASLDIRNRICNEAIQALRPSSSVCPHCGGISPTIRRKFSHLYFYFSEADIAANIKLGLLSKTTVNDWKRNDKRHNRTHTYMLPTVAREHIKELCQREHEVLGLLFPHMGESTVPTPFGSKNPLLPQLLYKVMFIDKVLVPPLPVRLSSGIEVVHNMFIPDDSTRALSRVLDFVHSVERYFEEKERNFRQQKAADPDCPLQSALDVTLSDTEEKDFEINVQNLQLHLNNAYAEVEKSFSSKQGLYRMYMMGKRVNQACRSVISPDYEVEPNEVLLPRSFAKRLTFPEQFNPHLQARATFLKRCALNGPHVYPGASHLEIRNPSGDTVFVDLDTMTQNRQASVQREFARANASSNASNVLIVHRHVLDGDRLIFNRQPTLHKVSMMGYRAKVLSGLKTLRFHYVNGKSYNADFDGDEMNIHVVQSIEAKAELETIMDANLQYLVPTSGKPIRGLIQDHIVAGVLLTLKDKFLDFETFSQYLYASIAPYMQRRNTYLRMLGSQRNKAGNSSVSLSALTYLIPPPAILKPKALWTGKQLISCIVRYVSSVSLERGGKPGAREGVSLKGISQIRANVYNTTDLYTGELKEFKNIPTDTLRYIDDDRVLFMQSEFITGVLCKNQLGPSNLSVAHVLYELYGPHVVGDFFGAMGRCLTISLQREGFSMGMDDMLLVQEERRANLLRELDNTPVKLASDEEAVVMPAIMKLATDLQKEFVPGRMLRPFPANQLLMMTVSGAKGSNTNTTQMALGLGQQLFDGRRVAVTNSGKTLPCFFAGERRARSFGYAIGRFATGIRPGEYTIHSMAGRDGLIDTAVKTALSGHLQRCLIKGMEGHILNWNGSVWDSSDSIVQFVYGEDGLDVVKSSTVHAYNFAKENLMDLCQRYHIRMNPDEEGGAAAEETHGKRGRGEEEEDIGSNTSTATMDGRRHFHRTPVNSTVNPTFVDRILSNEVRRNPLPEHIKNGIKATLQDKSTTFPLFRKVSAVARWEKQGKDVLEVLQQKRQETEAYYQDVITDLCNVRYQHAKAEMGDPVGLLAAQATGEPSTQMTLNTFHSAGSTVTHVTEGIPRLRELLMFGRVKNPAVVVPVVKATAVDEAALTRILKSAVSIKLQDCLAHVPSSPYKGYHCHVKSNAAMSINKRHMEKQLTVSLLFSKKLLHHARDCACMSLEEHVAAFNRTLLTFTRQLVIELTGVAKTGDQKPKKERKRTWRSTNDDGSEDGERRARKERRATRQRGRQ